MTNLEKELFRLLIDAECAIFYLVNDGDKTSLTQGKETLNHLREVLNAHEKEIIKEGV